jgi:hypothetical protein
MKASTIHPTAIRIAPDRPTPQAPPALLCYTIPGQQEHFLTNEVPNKAYLAELYVCGTSYRDIATLIAAHLPEETLPVCAIAGEGIKGWPDTMAGVKPERGVWASRYRHGAVVYRCQNGTRTEID